jgi:hypothetical protein
VFGNESGLQFHADNGRCLTATRSIRCANQACSLGLSVTIGSVFKMSGIFKAALFSAALLEGAVFWF